MSLNLPFMQVDVQVATFKVKLDTIAVLRTSKQVEEKMLDQASSKVLSVIAFAYATCPMCWFVATDMAHMPFIICAHYLCSAPCLQSFTQGGVTELLARCAACIGRFMRPAAKIAGISSYFLFCGG
jgi:hypothetical protein